VAITVGVPVFAVSPWRRRAARLVRLAAGWVWPGPVPGHYLEPGPRLGMRDRTAGGLGASRPGG